ncbi:MAG: hypothetical protein JWO62_2302 [Acidimicrobiaceae bacterium]|nr:hypothetical protein [Acidimicrobiaceae bacterium]
MPNLDPVPLLDRKLRPDVKVIGDAMANRVGDVVARVLDHDPGSTASLSTLAEEFATAVRTATLAVAEWVAGGDADVARVAGRDASRLFGRLAAHHETSLTEVTKRCLRWRDVVVEMAREEAGSLGASDEAFAHVSVMLAHSCDATLVRLCEAFEDERRRVHDELTVRQEQLRFQATHDDLTGLPNRLHILERTELALRHARRRETTVAALFVDLDNFKDVNDTLGHRAGDELLCSITGRLKATVPEGATLGRLGGDEFVVLLENLTEFGPAEALAWQMLDVLRGPFMLPGLDDRPLNVTASIGVAGGGDGSAEDLLRDADVAMYRAKWAGKNRVVRFEPEMQWAARSRLELDIELQLALDNHEFFLVYQPTFDLQDMHVTGVEALLRWLHPTRGVVVPGDFVPHLERSGLITVVGRWVLDQACRQGAAWHAMGYEVSISVNVSARQLDHVDFVEHVRSALDLSGIDPGSLTIEITETAIVRDTARSALRLAAVRALGPRIAVDDFGTGYSSLAHLQYFPVDALKIDRSFVSGMLRGREAEALVHTLVQLGKALGIETLAEGIEELPQLTHLRDEQCESGQGFLFAEPLEADEVGAFFSNWAGGVAALGTA